jgi:hypothetical protein
MLTKGIQILALLVLIAAPKPPRSLCCLCMCRSRDESKCSQMCIRLQHGKKIVEEPQMIECTATCKKKGVKTI